jgi:hypothetical protein
MMQYRNNILNQASVYPAVSSLQIGQSMPLKKHGTVQYLPSVHAIQMTDGYLLSSCRHANYDGRSIREDSKAKTGN